MRCQLKVWVVISNLVVGGSGEFRCSRLHITSQHGCGLICASWFSIRNFLTLFLSIEVSKAASDVADAKLSGDNRLLAYAEQRVQCFTDQLNDSNPILTEISEAMTDEGNFKAAMDTAVLCGDVRAASEWEKKMKGAEERKRQWNARLMECSARYSRAMKAMRETIECHGSASSSREQL